MFKITQYIIVFIVLGQFNLLNAQSKFFKEYFRAPLDIDLYLSATFGELRSNHFHSGIDFKTQGVTGHKIYAIADGYISRIKIMHSSYGKTLYITHENGYTSVYGHLKDFSDNLNKYVKSVQYEQEQHCIELFPKPGQFPVKKGELIAFGGNTGYSYGPHLHFEIRDENQYPLNPMLFGFDIKDNIPPQIRNIAIYPLDDDSYVNGKQDVLVLPAIKEKGKYIIAGNKPVNVHGTIGLGIETYDYLNGAPNRCGVYSIKLLVDTTAVYYHVMNEFSFYETRYINSHLDYKRIKERKKIQKTFIAPNNRLSIYKDIKDDGHLLFTEDKEYNIRFIVKDSYHNTSEAMLSLKNSSAPPLIRDTMPPITNFDVLMAYNKKNVFEQDNISITIPPYALYDNLKFTFNRSGGGNNYYSDIYHIHDQYVPVHKHMELSIKPGVLPEKNLEKLLIVSINDGKAASAGGEYIDSIVTTKVRSFGNYAVAIDTTPPTITPVNIAEGKNMGYTDVIKFIVEDDLSGISSYNGYIDNQWALFEFKLIDNLVYYYFDDEKIEKGQNHELELYVIDNKDNIAVYSTNFYY